MRFLTRAECIEWCRHRDLVRTPGDDRDSDSGATAKYRFKIPADAGQRVALCHLLWRYTVDIEGVQRLLVIQGWSVWPSGEHLPLFARLREACGERRSLMDVPGHVFEKGDDDDGLSFLIVATIFLWDFTLYSESGVTIVVSHDEVGTVFEPRQRPLTQLRHGLEQMRLLDE